MLPNILLIYVAANSILIFCSGFGSNPRVFSWTVLSPVSDRAGLLLLVLLVLPGDCGAARSGHDLSRQKTEDRIPATAETEYQPQFFNFGGAAGPSMLPWLSVHTNHAEKFLSNRYSTQIEEPTMVS